MKIEPPIISTKAATTLARSQIEKDYERARNTEAVKAERDGHIRSYRNFVRDEHIKFSLSAFFGAEKWKDCKKVLDDWCASPDSVEDKISYVIKSTKQDFVRVLSSSYVSDSFIHDYCTLQLASGNAKKRV